MMAESWTVSPDGLTVSFKIRDNLKFQSGASCDAAAIAACMNMYRDPTSGTPDAAFWTPVTAITPQPGNLLEMKLSHPYADLLPFVLPTGYTSIFNKAYRDTVGDKYATTMSDGTGPFVLKEFVPGSHLLVGRWEEYPGSIVPFFQNKGQAYLDGIRWEVLLEPATRAQELEAGNIDALHNPAPQDVPRLKSNPNLVVIEHDELSLYVLAVNFNRTDLGFNDSRVRLAFSHAIDRKAIAKNIFFGLATPTYTMVPSSDIYYDPSVEQFGTFDPNESKRLLDEAGWSMGANGIRESTGVPLSFKVIIEGQDKFEILIAQAVQAMLKNVGVDMTFTALEESAFFTQQAGPPAPDGYMMKLLWNSVIDVAILYSDSADLGPACCNYSLIKVPELDAAYNEWTNAATPADLEAASKKAQRIFAEQAAWVSLVTPKNIWVHNKKVHGWFPPPNTLYPYYNDVWMEQ
jgi:peptide/nickel transport system substrate-binding protein